MDAILQRVKPRAPGFPVLGSLVMPSGTTYATLEDPYILRPGDAEIWPFTGYKLMGVTAIPANLYRVIVGWSTRFQRDLPRILEVPRYTGILLHPGNRQEDTQGCILVGREHLPDGKTLAGSTEAITEIVNEIRSITEPLYIDVRNPS